MAKLNAEEFNNKYAEKITENDDLLIELMEDFSDSITPAENEELENLKVELEKAQADYIELKEKYKQRFLSAVEDKKEEEPVEGLEEQEVIDIKEI